MVPRVRTKHNNTALQFYAKSKIWNSLSGEVSQDWTLPMFKSKLKIVIFSHAYDRWKDLIYYFFLISLDNDFFKIMFNLYLYF